MPQAAESAGLAGRRPARSLRTVSGESPLEIPARLAYNLGPRAYELTAIMKRTSSEVFARLALPLALSLVCASLDARAEPASAPAGFYKVDCLGNSDTIVSIPFTRPEAAFALVQSVADNVVTVQNTPGWTDGQFVYAAGTQTNTYYLRFLSGAKEGSYYPIVDNAANTLTLNLAGDDISSVTAGDRLAVIPYWTLATAFPEGKGVIPSTSKFGGIFRRTEILIPDFDGVGINRSAATTFYYYKPAESPTGDWYEQGDLINTQNDRVLLPDLYFIVRHNNSPVGTTFTAQGSVPTSRLTTPLVAQTSGFQDNFVALTRPAPISLNASGLLEGGFLPSANLNPESGDQLLVFDNDLAAMNKSASATYYYRNGVWRKGGDLIGDWGDEPIFQPGSGVIIRKKAVNNGGTSSFWINSPTY